MLKVMIDQMGVASGMGDGFQEGSLQSQLAKLEGIVECFNLSFKWYY